MKSQEVAGRTEIVLPFQCVLSISQNTNRIENISSNCSSSVSCGNALNDSLPSGIRRGGYSHTARGSP